MVLVITENIIKDREAYLPLAKAFAADAVKNDKGCHSLEVYVDPEVKDKVVFVSKWDTKEDFMAHIQGATFQKHIPDMGAFYVSGTDTFLELI